MIKSGASHEDIGYGVSKDADQGSGLERAKKAAVTDARKRALRCFGEVSCRFKNQSTLFEQILVLCSYLEIH